MVVGQEQLLALPKVDMMRWLPSPDTGDMRDFFDEMSERERREWNARYTLIYMMQTPAFEIIQALDVSLPFSEAFFANYSLVGTMSIKNI